MNETPPPTQPGPGQVGEDGLERVAQQGTAPDPARVPERADRRDGGPKTGTPRELLDYWLDLYRETTLIKVAGLDAEQLCRRPVAGSSLSLVGLVRHLTYVEGYWVRTVIEGDEDTPPNYCTRENADADFDDIDPAAALADVAFYEREVAATAGLLEGWTDLEALARGLRHGQPLNLGWVLTHLVEEYARHLGHMDILRELVDGRTGY